MSLTDQLQPLFERLPEDKRAARRAFWDRLVAEGFPGTKHERWRFTDLAGAVAEPPTSPGPAQIELPSFEGLRRVGFINGHTQSVDDRERLEAPATSVSDPSDLVNAALAASGLQWQPEGDDTALHLCTRSTEGSVHLRHRIHVPTGAHAVLYWDDLAETDADFGTQTLEIQLDDNARLDVARSHLNNAGGPQLLRSEARLAAGATLNMTGFDAGSGLSRHNLQIMLDAPGARVLLNGVYAPFAKGHIDTFASVDHASRETVSRMHFRGLGMEKGTGLLTGRVHVHRDAQRADSDQQLAGLLLSPKARINAKPELEIYADDVVCAHGNAIGQIDENALHYLQTRGIDRATARAMLINGFAAETLAFPANEGAHADLLKALDNALQHADWSETP
jgi:Fe-S cluster assembly protein SufD